MPDIEVNHTARNPCHASDACDDHRKISLHNRPVVAKHTEEERIGRRIHTAILRLGVTITDVGLAWGGSRQTAQHWIKGNHLPAARYLGRLCKMLLIDANELLDISPLSMHSEADQEAARASILEYAEQRRLALKSGASTGRRLAKGKGSSSPTQARLGSSRTTATK